MQCFAACDIIHLKKTDTFTLHFTVTCPPNDGHLGGYTLEAHSGPREAIS
jgi:hypothetical protein